MKSVPFLAAGLLLGASVAVAQQPTDVPPAKCEKPQMPGARMMEDSTVRRRFERDMKAHENCVKGYVAERQASAKALQEQAKAHADAANTAVNDYNAFLKSVNEAAK